MVCQPLRLALLIGAITAVAVSPARADFGAPSSCDSCGSSSSATAPCYRGCTEWVKEAYQVKRTTYKVECKTETYDTVRCESVPVCKEKVVTYTKKVPVWKEECRKVCHKVNVCEERTVNKTCHKFVQETCMKKKLVRLGHWECKEVTPLFSGGLFSGHGCHTSSCDSGCGSSCGSACETSCCKPTRTRQVWVHCPEYQECPVTVCKKVCYTECVKVKVNVCKNEWREEKVKVCSYQCVQESKTVKYTCYEQRQVACKATRTVRVCVPCETTQTCYKWVRREVAPAPACTTSCTPSCDTCSSGGLFSRLRERFACHSSCDTGCSSRDCCRDGCK